MIPLTETQDSRQAGARPLPPRPDRDLTPTLTDRPLLAGSATSAFFARYLPSHGTIRLCPATMRSFHCLLTPEKCHEHVVTDGPWATAAAARVLSHEHNTPRPAPESSLPDGP